MKATPREQLRPGDTDRVDERGRSATHAAASTTGQWVENPPLTQALECPRTGPRARRVRLGVIGPEATDELPRGRKTTIGYKAQQQPILLGQFGSDTVETTGGDVDGRSKSGVFPC